MKKNNFNSKQVTFSFLPHGDIKEVSTTNILINQFIGNEFNGSLNNLFLRVFKEESCQVYPLIGKASNSICETFEEGITWSGEVEGITYQVSFRLSDQDMWFWQVNLTGNSEQVDVVYGQDLGLAARGVILSNEAYNSQYVDHFIDSVDGDFVVCSRQNMPQGSDFPYLQQGSLTPNTHYSTDGYQFFEKNNANSMVSKLANTRDLESQVYQYEMAYTGLQSEKITLSDENQQVIFYGAFLPSHREAIAKAKIDKKDIMVCFNNLPSLGASLGKELPVTEAISDVSGEVLTPAEVDSLFPSRRVEETSNEGELLSFFDENDYHVVLKEKELLMERSHGHIIISGEESTIENPVLASTLYMNGLFNSQIVLGNTTVNKFISNSRNALNLLKKSGQRLFVKQEGKWQRLGLPSAFKMGFNFGTWYYKLNDDLIEISSYTVSDSRSVQFEIISHNQKQYEWLTSFDVVMNDNEGSHDYEMVRQEQQLLFTPTAESSIFPKYPDLRYGIEVKQAFDLVSAADYFQMSTNENLVMIHLPATEQVSLTIQGTLLAEPFKEVSSTLEEASQSYNEYLANLSNHFHLNHTAQERVDKMNVLVKWYSHNMLVHYLSPHGLEQYGGAAWGTRDVCQGPVEYFFAMNKPEMVRSIILTIYANQFSDDGNWPQWFMFDKFEEIKADESHGDIIVWPLKVVSDYLHVTKDYSVLDEMIPYSSRVDFKKTTEEETLLQHINKQITYIEDNFLEDTFLSCYGDGDWDDTLQPADQTLKKNMASSWTVALTYQTFKLFSEVMSEYNEAFSLRSKDLSVGIYKDFHTYMLSDEVIPGFLYMDEAGKPELIIHPSDKKTGITYRLLPMTRSMISELIDEEEVAKHVEIIEKNLVFPDAVRLMNQPAHYKGGVSQIFKRAEQAANLGREVGLAYIHAHIRYVEAMAKIGKRNETWSNLEKINPIGIQEVVSNSELRQANAYFSSSDGDFKTRYDAQDNFNELKTQDRGVKGGWRIYSSGPGIYINQLISNVLGIRKNSEQLLFDPVLPEELTDLVLTYQFEDRLLKIKFNLTEPVKGLKINGKLIETEEKQNRYRNEGLVISLDTFYSNTMNEGVNEIELFIGEM